MKHKQRAQKSLEQSGAVLMAIQDKKIQDSKNAEIKKNEITEQVLTNNNKENTMITKSMKRKLQAAKAITNALGGVALDDKGNRLGSSNELFETYAKAAMESEGANAPVGVLLNDIIDPVLQIDFNADVPETALMGKMKTVPMKGVHTKKVYFNKTTIKFYGMAEAADIRDLASQNKTEFRFKTLSLERLSTYAEISAELKNEAIHDIVGLVKNEIDTQTPITLFDAFINGSKGTLDAGVAATDPRKFVGEGLRATCLTLGAVKGHVVDFAGAVLSRTNLKSFLKSAGKIADATKHRNFTLLVSPQEEDTITDLKRASGAGVAVNETSLTEESYLGVSMARVYALPVDTAANGKVSATPADNTKGTMALVDLSCINYAIENAELSIEYISYKRIHAMCVNLDAGCVVMTDDKNQYAVLAINIGRPA